MEFKQVPVESLIINKRYKIIYEDHSYITEPLPITAILYLIRDNMLVFHKMRYDFYETDRNYLSPYDYYTIYKIALPFMKFYIPKNKELAQQSMEKRALNKIVQRVLGDTHFQWF
jgi:hypothetical protein